MPLTFQAVDQPPFMDVAAEEVVTVRHSPRNATPATPTPQGVSAVMVMPPVAAAGVQIVYIVLGITAGSIVFLLLYLLTMDLRIGNDVRAAYRDAMGHGRVGAEVRMLGRLEQLSLDLDQARRDPGWQLPATSLVMAQEVVGALGQVPSVTVGQKAALAQCIPLPPADLPPAVMDPTGAVAQPSGQPAGTGRGDVLARCLGVLESIRQAALEAAGNAANIQIAGEASSRINEHRQSLHAFWIQAAQLVLLNLLLPLLTALFGYIFGTQQAQRNNPAP